MGRSYLIRYGLARALGRFESTSGDLERGQAVVIRTHRGTELGEVLSQAPSSLTSDAEPAPILRAASPEDIERARTRAERDRPAHFEACRAVFEAGTWPLEMVDTEPLLDEGRTVLHYLGAHHLDASGLIAAFRERCGLDVVLEPVGRDIPEPEPVAVAHDCGSCGSSGGGCSTGGGCGTGSGGCAVKSLIAARRRVDA